MPVGRGKPLQKMQTEHTPLGLGFHGRSPLLIYRETNKKGEPEIFVQKSTDGVRFDKPRKKLKMLTERGSIEAVDMITRMQGVPVEEGEYFVYARRKGRTETLVGALSKDLASSRGKGKIASGNPSVAWVNHFQHKDKHLMYLGGETVSAAYSKDFKKWTKAKTGVSGEKLWGAVNTAAGILLLVDRSKSVPNGTNLRIEGFLFRHDNPSEVAWSGESMLFEEHFEGTATPFGAVSLGEEIRLYWLDQNTELHTVKIPQPFHSPMQVGISALTKAHHVNPVLSPKPHHWESVATFNPAALYDGEKVHLLYRAIGSNNMSSVGYATSEDGLTFDERLNYPIYHARTPSEGVETLPWQATDEYTSGGGGWGGCEDPRITLIDDKVYMTYVAYNGWEAPRVAITSIGFDNFKAGKWQWRKPLLISRPEQVNKNAALFPEKINGKYVLFHRIFPNMLIDFLPDLDFKKKRWLTGDAKISPRASFWDSRKLGVGPPPLKTEAGWLVVYQGVDDRDPGRYKMGAMILDVNDPAKVLYRARLPIAVPDAEYENQGHKWGVIYPCGAAVIKGQLYIYYGGADMVTCVAHTPLDAFIDNVKKDSVVSLKPEKVTVKK